MAEIFSILLWLNIFNANYLNELAIKGVYVKELSDPLSESK